VSRLVPGAAVTVCLSVSSLHNWPPAYFWGRNSAANHGSPSPRRRSGHIRLMIFISPVSPMHLSVFVYKSTAFNTFHTTADHTSPYVRNVQILLFPDDEIAHEINISDWESIVMDADRCSTGPSACRGNACRKKSMLVKIRRCDKLHHKQVGGMAGVIVRARLPIARRQSRIGDVRYLHDASKPTRDHLDIQARRRTRRDGQSSSLDHLIIPYFKQHLIVQPLLESLR
jgi:hypothetical protein